MSFRTADLHEDEVFEYLATLEFNDILEFDHEDTEFVNKYDPNKIKYLIETENTDEEDKQWHKELFGIPLDD